VTWAEHVARMGLKRNVYEILVAEGKIQFGRSNRRCEDNIQLDLKCYAGVCIVCMWLKLGTSGGLL
jgi:hypothetical protein